MVTTMLQCASRCYPQCKDYRLRPNVFSNAFLLYARCSGAWTVACIFHYHPHEQTQSNLAYNICNFVVFGSLQGFFFSVFLCPAQTTIYITQWPCFTLKVKLDKFIVEIFSCEKYLEDML